MGLKEQRRIAEEEAKEKAMAASDFIGGSPGLRSF